MSKSANVKVPKNPASIVLGLVLRNLRVKTLLMSSDEVGKRLDLSPSNYRLLESGATNLQPGRTLRVVNVFPTIEFSCLANFLVANDILWYPDITFQELKTRLEDLQAAVPNEMQAFLSKLLVELENNSRRLGEFRKAVEKSSLPQTLETFLKGPARTTTINDTAIARHYIPSDLSPFFVDVFVNSMNSLAGMSLRFSPLELFTFENKNADRFTEVWGVLRTTELFLGNPFYEVGKHFVPGYLYLWRRFFTRLTIFYFGTESPASVKARFQDALTQMLRRNLAKFAYELKNFDAAIEKVTCIKIDDLAQSTREEMDQKVLHYNGRKMNHFWLFLFPEMNHLKGTDIGFLDNAPATKQTEVTPECFGEVLSSEQVGARKHVIEKALASMNV